MKKIIELFFFLFLLIHFVSCIFEFKTPRVTYESNYQDLNISNDIIKYRVIENNKTILELVEKKDLSNNTLWYRAEIETEVCRERLCEFAKINLYWDEVGNYLKFALPESKELTKWDHIPFNSKDYQKLNDILGNPNSKLRDYTFNEINDVIESGNKIDQEVDALSGATPVKLSNTVVEGAALSSYTFWHIVYGAAMDTIKQHVKEKTDKKYVCQKLTSTEANLKIWAIKKSKELFQTENSLRHEIMQLISEPDLKVAREALNFFTDSQLEKKDIQEKLMNQFYMADPAIKYDILERQKQLQVIHPETLYFLIKEFAEERIGILAFSSIMNIANKVKEPSEKTIEIMGELLLSDNYYIAKNAYKIVKYHPSNKKELKRKMKTFEKKYADRID